MSPLVLPGLPRASRYDSLHADLRAYLQRLAITLILHIVPVISILTALQMPASGGDHTTGVGDVGSPLLVERCRVNCVAGRKELRGQVSTLTR